MDADKMTFWEFVNERHSIYLRKSSGQPKPWTTHEILQRNYFCNIFRELDTTTIWYAEHIRRPLENRQEILLATAIFRWFNFIGTGEILLKNDLFCHWNSKIAIQELQNRHKVITGAYMIKSPTGMDKLHGICWAIDQMWPKRHDMFLQMDGKSLKEAWKVLLPFPFMGPFMAYEIITDLRHSFMLRDAPDIMTWANIGPGAKRGLKEIAKDSTPKRLGLDYMEFLLKESTDPRVWPFDKPMEMRDIEHSLCEYSKYCQAFDWKRLKRRYNGTNC